MAATWKMPALLLGLATIGIVPYILFGSQFAPLTIFFGGYALIIGSVELGVYVSKRTVVSL